MFHFRHFILFIFSVFNLSAYASYHTQDEIDSKTYAYHKSSYIDDYTWHTLTPLFFPSNHSLKAKIDKIFSRARVTTNIETMKTAGFEIIGKRMQDKALVAKHSKLPGLIFKLYLDDHRGMNEIYFLVNRLKGVALIKNFIKLYDYENYFDVPQKWLYPLPDFPVATGERKTIILIEEELKLVSRKKNKSMFYDIDPHQLNALYHMISSLGLSDSVFIMNIPFTNEGKMAFIDTERFHLWDIKYRILTPHLRPEMQQYWKILTGYN